MWGKMGVFIILKRMEQAKWESAQAARIASWLLQSPIQLVGVFEAIQWAGLFLLWVWSSVKQLLGGKSVISCWVLGTLLRLSLLCCLITQTSLRNNFLCPKRHRALRAERETARERSLMLFSDQSGRWIGNILGQQHDLYLGTSLSWFPCV
jgi:hypothetical protein